MKSLQILLLLFGLAPCLFAASANRQAGGVNSALQFAKITPSDSQLLDGFGASIAISGSTLAVGAPCSHPQGATCGHGAVYVYVKPASGWGDMTQTAKLTASDGADEDHFGISVAFSGDTLVVGADMECITGNEPGKAYVFQKPQAGWQDMTQTAELTSTDNTGCLGHSVGISGNVIIAGAKYESVAGNHAQGAAFVFLKPRGGWHDSTQSAKLVSSDGQFLDEFGSSVAVSGSTAIVGAPLAGGARGAAYIYANPTGHDSLVTETAKLTATFQNGNALFGVPVAIDGDTAVIGEQGCLGEGDPHGNAYVFVKPLGGWTSGTQTAKLGAPDNLGCDEFPSALAIDQNVVIASEVFAHHAYGALYAFVGPAKGWQDTSIPNLAVNGPDVGTEPDSFGGSVAFRGCTLAVGSPGGAVIPDVAYVYARSCSH